MNKISGTPQSSTVSYRLVIIAALFVCCLITANIIIVKQINLAGFTLPAAVVIFPISYILGDVLTEVYGYEQSRRIIWLGFACNLLAVGAIWVAQILPAASVFDGQSAYERILGSAPRFVAASFAAYLAGEFTNSYVLAKMKVHTKGRWLWMRTIGSTIVGQAVDTSIVLTIAFAGVLPMPILGAMILTHWTVKTLYETMATPLTYLIVGYLKRKENQDTYDYTTDFNPLRVG